MKFTHYIYLTTVAAICALLGMTGAALAADTVDPVDGSLDLATTIYNAFTGGHRAYAAALAIVAVVALVRKKWGATSPWMHTDAGSALMVLVGTFGTTLVASLTGGGAFTAHMAWAALCVAFSTAGGYAMVKKLVVEPGMVPLATRAPTPLKQMLQAVIWFFVHTSDPANQAPAAAPAQAPTPAPAPPAAPAGNAPTAPSVP